MNYKHILILTLALLLFRLPVYAGDKETVTFNACIDGDTAAFNLDDEKIKVRFLAIDTPESVHPTKKVEAFGKEASNYVCDKITKAEKIELEYDAGSAKTDKYGRFLAWIWVDDLLLQKELLALGYAKVDYIYGKYAYTEELYLEEEQAKAKKIGLWADYIPKTYTVLFVDEEVIKEVTVNENEKIVSFEPEKAGYEFISWQLDEQDFDFATLINEDLTLVALYQKEYNWVDYILLILLALVLLLTNKKSFKKKLKKYF